MELLWLDVRQAARRLATRPGFTTAAHKGTREPEV